jgi:hypothetical protein
VIAAEPAIDEVSAALYVIPTDAPEADRTLSWTQTTTVLGLELRTTDAARYRRAWHMSSDTACRLSDDRGPNPDWSKDR